MSAPREAFHAERSDIEDWKIEAIAEGATHLIVAFDRFSGDSYPVYVIPGQTVADRIGALDEYQRVDEVIPLGGVEKVRDAEGHEHGADGGQKSEEALEHGESKAWPIGGDEDDELIHDTEDLA